MDPFLAEIRILAFDFAPRGWARCDGQLLPLSQNTALFSLLGTMYGGNGKSNFALPDLGGRVPMHWGQGPGLEMREQGETGGEEHVTLLNSEMPAHHHPVSASPTPATLAGPAPNTVLARSRGVAAYVAAGGAMETMAAEAAPPAGSGQPHNNMQPYLTLGFCIAMQGVYPPRT